MFDDQLLEVAEEVDGVVGFFGCCPFSLDGFMEQPVVRDMAGNLEPKTFLDSIGLEDEEDWSMVRQGRDPFSGFALAAIGRGSTSHEGFMMVCSEVECE